MPRNNRKAGHTFEQWARLFFVRLGWEKCLTSRYASRMKDDQKVDLCFTDPFNVQLKYTQAINFHTELGKMPDGRNYNIVMHKRKNAGVVVAMSLEDFEDILKSALREGVIKTSAQADLI